MGRGKKAGIVSCASTDDDDNVHAFLATGRIQAERVDQGIIDD